MARTFLEALFAGLPKGFYILLWTLPEKRSIWCRTVDEAILAASKFKSRTLYVGVGLAPQDFGVAHRCLAKDIVGIVGIWTDLDLHSDAHPKASLPSTTEDALSILPGDLPPTFVIGTGNGVQAWWLFREIWIFESDEERRAAGNLARRFNSLIAGMAGRHGWTHDRLADLSRLLRVPGTTNCKDPANPKPVRILSQSDQRYNPSDLSDYLDNLAVPSETDEPGNKLPWAERVDSQPIVIDLSARIAEDRIERWCESDPRFKATWFRQRPDIEDQSGSGYDMALADFGYRVKL